MPRYKQIDRSYKPYRYSTWNSQSERLRNYPYREGTVFTAHGPVLAYAWEGAGATRPSSHLQFWYRGRMYDRWFQGVAFTRLGLARKANAFAREIVGNNETDS